jgi:hypothetical protein
VDALARKLNQQHNPTTVSHRQCKNHTTWTRTTGEQV